MLLVLLLTLLLGALAWLGAAIASSPFAMLIGCGFASWADQCRHGREI